MWFMVSAVPFIWNLASFSLWQSYLSYVSASMNKQQELDMSNRCMFVYLPGSSKCPVFLAVLSSLRRLSSSFRLVFSPEPFSCWVVLVTGWYMGLEGGVEVLLAHVFVCCGPGDCGGVYLVVVMVSTNSPLLF